MNKLRRLKTLSSRKCSPAGGSGPSEDNDVCRCERENLSPSIEVKANIRFRAIVGAGNMLS